jgi:hypothetical protein
MGFFSQFRLLALRLSFLFDCEVPIPTKNWHVDRPYRTLLRHAESKSRYYTLLIGGFDGTSNVLAGKLFNIPVKGTHAHAYVTSFSGAEDLVNAKIKHKSEDYVETDFFAKCLDWRTKLATHLKIMRDEAHDGELAAFASYAVAFPDGFLALVDTYDVSRYRLPKCTLMSSNHHQFDLKIRPISSL